MGAPALHGHGDKFASHKLPVVSAKWMRDEGIVRLLKSFNSWTRLKGKLAKDKDTAAAIDTSGVGKSSMHSRVCGCHGNGMMQLKGCGFITLRKLIT